MSTKYEPNIAERLGRRIRYLRRRREWRQEDLATAASTTQTHVSAVELGQREVCLFTLERIAIALDTTPSELLK